jgi:hypothetical protein
MIEAERSELQLRAQFRIHTGFPFHHVSVSRKPTKQLCVDKNDRDKIQKSKGRLIKEGKHEW